MIKHLTGDCRELLKTLPDKSVHCCITSPPYWGLRDYGVDGQIGLEKTPELYVAALVGVFREVWRVMRDDGTLWLNLGSSYARAEAKGQHKPGDSGKQDYIITHGGGRAASGLQMRNAHACGTDDTGSPKLVGSDRVCPYCGGELQDGSAIRRAYSARKNQQTEPTLPQPSPTNRGISHSDSALASPPPSAACEHPSTIASSNQNAQALRGPEEKASGHPSKRDSFSHDVAVSDRTSACTSGTAQRVRPSSDGRSGTGFFCKACGYCTTAHPEFKEKDIIPTPWMVAFGLQSDGWFLRSDIVWCLSGGTWIYVWTEDSGECLMTVKDLFRIKDQNVKLWNGHTWTPLAGMSKSRRSGCEIEFVLRSGERISCTLTHQFPTTRGVLPAAEIKKGDCLIRCALPDTYDPKDCSIERDAAWFAGLYLAEGSRSGSAIQIAGHAKEERRWREVSRIAKKFGGSATRTVDGNGMAIRVYGRILHAIIDELVCGRTAHDKGFSPVTWRYSNAFLEAMLRGYVEGDGHYEEKNKRWRLGFCRNYNLERDLRTVCARLGFHIVLKLARVKYEGRYVPSFRGEIRESRSGHFNEKDTAEIVEIRKARCREVYDIGVAEPHLFALSSGILTHNSKANPMPESVTDRPTKSHEFIFLLTKKPRYFYDSFAIREETSGTAHSRGAGVNPKANVPNPRMMVERTPEGPDGKSNPSRSNIRPKQNASFSGAVNELVSHRNRRDVWTVASEPYKGAHYATFPKAIITPCILAGTSSRGACSKCGAPWGRILESVSHGKLDYNGKHSKTDKGTDGRNILASVRAAREAGGDHDNPFPYAKTVGWQPTCECGESKTVPCVVLDPFAGSGTVGLVATECARDAILIELNPQYTDMALQRTNVTPGLPIAL